MNSADEVVYVYKNMFLCNLQRSIYSFDLHVWYVFRYFFSFFCVLLPLW